MQYILTQNELDDLSDKHEMERYRDAAQVLSIMIAERQNLHCPAAKFKPMTKPKYGYCNDCPACKYCPYENKDYAK